RQGANRTGPPGLALRFHSPPGPVPAWPAPVTTDDEGRFVFDGLGPSLTVDVEVHDPRYATQRFYLRTGPTEQAGEVTFNLAPARTLEGRITAEDTGLPLANAFVTVETARLDAAALRCAVDGRTDADGFFRLRPFPGQDFHLRVWPPTGSPYLVTR